MMKLTNPILQLALPSVVANITVPLLGVVDTAIVGHMGKAEYIASVAIGTTMLNMMYWLCGFLRMGTTGIVSQAHGSGDEQRIREGLTRSLLFGLFIGLCLLLLQSPLLRLALWLMEPEAEVLHYTTAYFRVCIWGAPAMLAGYSLTGWFIGMQNTRIPMCMAILQNLLNIFCTLLFVFVLDMGIRGVALGTVVGIYGGVVAAPLLSSSKERGLLRDAFRKRLSRRNERVALSFDNLRFWRTKEGTLYRDLFLRTLCLVGVTVYFTTAGSRMGTLTLDANALLMQFFMLYSYFTDALANAAEALSGEYLGRRDGAGLRGVVRQLFAWGGCFALVFTLLYATAATPILHLFTNQTEVIAYARPYLPWVIVIPFVSLAAFIWDGVYIGLTLTSRMFLSMLVSAIVFFALWLLLGPGNHALWFSFVAYLATRSLMQTVLISRYSVPSAP